MDWQDIKTKSGRRSFMWLLGAMIILATMLLPVLAFAKAPEVQKASAAYIQAKTDYLRAKGRLLTLEKEIRAQEIVPLPENVNKTPTTEGVIRLEITPKDIRAYNEKRARLYKQYRSDFEQLNSFQQAVYDTLNALQEAVKFSQPPILKAVSFRSEKRGEMYNAVWESNIPDPLRQKIAEQKQLLNKIETRIQERFAARKPLIGQQKKYSDVYVKHAAIYTDNTINVIISTSLIEAVGMIAGVFIDQPGTALNMATLVGSAIAKKIASGAGADSDYDFVSQLQKYRKDGSLKKESSDIFKSTLTGDAIEEIIDRPLGMAITCVAKASVQAIDAKVMEELVSDAVGKGYAKSLGLGVAVSVVKGMVGEYFQQEADMAKKNAFEAYVGHEFFQQIINKSIQGDAPFVQARQQLRHNIFELNKQAKCANNVWSKKVSISNPFRSMDIKNDIRVSLTFSAPLHNTPKVKLRSFKVAVKPVGDLPTSRFDGQVAVPTPKKDGTYEYRLNVRVSRPDLFDGNPETTATYDTKNSIWRQAEPFDKEHTIQIISYEKLIKELEGYVKELGDYIAFMDKRVGYHSFEKFVHDSLTRAGVKEAAGYSYVWGQEAVYRWDLNDDSAEKYLLRHVEALSSSIGDLPGMARVSNEEIQQFRKGMQELRIYMQMTKKAFLVCWPGHLIERGKLWDKHVDLDRQYYAIPSPPTEKDQARRQQLNALSSAANAKSDEAGSAAGACLKPVKDEAASPAFVSLKTLRKE